MDEFFRLIPPAMIIAYRHLGDRRLDRVAVRELSGGCARALL